MSSAAAAVHARLTHAAVGVGPAFDAVVPRGVAVGIALIHAAIGVGQAFDAALGCAIADGSTTRCAGALHVRRALHTAHRNGIAIGATATALRVARAAGHATKVGGVTS